MKASVALCTYNGERYLNEQLDSILSQTVAVDEIIICDDGSNDKTVAILFGYQEKYPGIFKVYQNETNLGFIKNFEKAIKLCSHEVIIISDQDDVWEKDKVKETLHFFTSNTQFDGVFHDLKLIDNETIHSSYLNWKKISHEEILKEISEKELFTALVNKGSFILGCALAIRKEALQSHHLENFPIAHDYFIVQKLSIKNKLGFIPKSLSSYRLHANQVYGLRYNSDKKHVEKLSKSKQYFKDYVHPYMNALKRAGELSPGEDLKKTELYSKFIARRNTYLNTMGFIRKKLYIAKCVRYQYLDLKPADIFTI